MFIAVPAHGNDPQQTKETRRTSVRFDDVVARFLATSSARQHRPATHQEFPRVLQREFVAKWATRDVGEIVRADVHAILDAIVARGAPVSANHALAVLRKFFN